MDIYPREQQTPEALSALQKAQILMAPASPGVTVLQSPPSRRVTTLTSTTVPYSSPGRNRVEQGPAI